MFSRFFNKAHSEPQKDAEQSISNDSNDGFSILSTTKLKALIMTLNKAEPIFHKAGYLMVELDVVFGEKPKLTPHFKRMKSISDEQQSALLAELNEQQLIKFILISLHKSSRMQSLFIDSELYYYGMEIDISSVPSVKTIFKRKDSMAQVIPLKPKS